MAYTINIENKDRPLERNIFIESDNVSVNSWYGEDYIELGIGENAVYGIHMDKKDFLELYEMMTILKKYIDEK